MSIRYQVQARHMYLAGILWSVDLSDKWITCKCGENRYTAVGIIISGGCLVTYFLIVLFLSYYNLKRLEERSYLYCQR